MVRRLSTYSVIDNNCPMDDRRHKENNVDCQRYVIQYSIATIICKSLTTPSVVFLDGYQIR